jgi:hypothetical protein
MTSSYLLQQRFAHGKDWRFGNPDAPYRGMEDHYLRPWGECHPDYEANPIGTPTGAKVCVRRPFRRETTPTPQGYFRGSVNLYAPQDRVPSQKWNPYPYHDRRIPWEGQLVRDGYVDLPTRYNGTGIGLVATPAELNPNDEPFLHFPYSFMPDEDPRTGLRTATSWKQQIPPPKYDITRLNQPYDLWVREQERIRKLTPQQLQNYSDTNQTRISSV